MHYFHILPSYNFNKNRSKEVQALLEGQMHYVIRHTWEDSMRGKSQVREDGQPGLLINMQHLELLVY